MNKVNINIEDNPLPWKDALAGFAIKVLNEINCNNWDLSILLCGDETITELNSKYRGRTEATDILSFNMGTEIQEGDEIRYLPGDIVISLDTLRENAKLYNVSEDEELRRLVIHGILHLDGMEHKTNDKEDPMIALQEDIFKKFINERIFPC
jgi:probable rRNA maturation factor